MSNDDILNKIKSPKDLKKMTQKQYTKLIIFGLICVVMMIFAFGFYESLRNTELISTTDKLINRGDANWKYSRTLFMPYMYIVQGFSELQYIVNGVIQHTYGMWLIKPLMGYLTLDNIFADLYQLKADTFFNTFTFMGVEYIDFGIIGSGVISLILGIYVKKIYLAFLKKRTVWVIATYTLVGVAVFQMYFSNHFLQQSYPITIFLLGIIYIRIRNIKIR